MSIFPTKILLATDGSEEAELAALRAVDIAENTDSELHVVHVGVVPRFLEGYSGTLGYDRKIYEEIEEESRELLRKLTWQVKVAGGVVAGAHLRMGGGGPGDRGLGQGARGRSDRHGMPGPSGDKEGHRR